MRLQFLRMGYAIRGYAIEMPVGAEPNMLGDVRTRPDPQGNTLRDGAARLGQRHRLRVDRSIRQPHADRMSIRL